MTAEEFAQLLAQFGLDAFLAREIGRSQNFVYEVPRHGTEYIARISAARHRTRTQIEAELSWMRVLAQRGIAVCPPLLSVRSQWCEEKFVNDTSFVLSVFTKAPGRKPERADVTATLAYRIGELIGQMHSAAAWATSSGQSFARDDWRSSRLLTHDMANTSAPVGEQFRDAVCELNDAIAAIPVEPFTFGLIHGDVNSGNCHLDSGRLWIFDFDNCEYGYFLQDIVVMLYDTLYSKFVKHVPPDAMTATVLNLWCQLVAGYRTTGPSLKLHAEHLRRFFLLREAIIYVHYHRIFPAAQMAADGYVAGMKAHVEKMSHPLDFDRLADV